MKTLCAVGFALCALTRFGSHGAQLTAQSTQPRAPTAQRVSISRFTFAPAELTVSPGDTIVWTNDDPFLHTTTADSGAWSSPELAQGKQFLLVAKQAGRFSYHCAAHPVMRGVIVVRQ